MSSDERHYGLYRGICKDTADPLNKNRIRVLVPQLFGPDMANLTNWADACSPVVIDAEHGANGTTSVTTSSVNDGGTGASPHSHSVTLTAHQKVPNINQGVWIMFEGGDVNFPVWIGVY